MAGGAGTSPELRAFMGMDKVAAMDPAGALARFMGRSGSATVDVEPVEPAGPAGPAEPPNSTACSLQRLDARNISLQRFRDEYQGQRPVLLTHVTDGWAATERWATAAAVVSAHGDLRVPLQDTVLLGSRGSFAPVIGEVSLGTYVQSSGHKEGCHRPTFHNRWHAITDALLADSDFAGLPTRMLRIHHIASIGYRGAGVGLHSHGEGWLAQVTGRKGWYLVPSLAHAALVKNKHGCELFARPAREGVDQCVV
eukprot:COSAG02_NODE_12765_length_1498_cov_1.358828_1_plen_252_part_10